MVMISGMNNGGIIRIVMKPKFFIKFLEVLINDYDEYIIAGITNMLGISKYTTKEKFEEYTEFILKDGRPIFIEIKFSDYNRIGMPDTPRIDSFNPIKSYLAYTTIMHTITSNIVHNQQDEKREFSHEDYEITNPYSQDGARFYLKEFFNCLEGHYGW